MINLIRFLDKNSFGRTTWEFKLFNYYKVKLHETNNGFLVELFEPNWITYKKSFSYSSSLDFDRTIEDSFEEIFEFVSKRGEFNWSRWQKEEDKKEVISQHKRYINWR